MHSYKNNYALFFINVGDQPVFHLPTLYSHTGAIDLVGLMPDMVLKLILSCHICHFMAAYHWT